MVMMDESECHQCHTAAGDLEPEAGPEFCECCEQVLCERCWFASHVLVMY